MFPQLVARFVYFVFWKTERVCETGCEIAKSIGRQFFRIESVDIDGNCVGKVVCLLLDFVCRKVEMQIGELSHCRARSTCSRGTKKGQRMQQELHSR